MIPNELLFLQATRTLFSLMKILGSMKNQYAPLIYKILVNAFASFSDISKVKNGAILGGVHVLKLHRQFQGNNWAPREPLGPTPPKAPRAEPIVVSN